MSNRQEKVSRLLQKELGDIFQKERVTTFKGAMISVTTVRISPDLSFAKVYVSIFSPGIESSEIFSIIQSTNIKTRHILAKRVRHQLRIVPELAYHIDDSLDYIEKIDNLLNN